MYELSFKAYGTKNIKYRLSSSFAVGNKILLLFHTRYKIYIIFSGVFLSYPLIALQP